MSRPKTGKISPTLLLSDRQQRKPKVHRRFLLPLPFPIARKSNFGLVDFCDLTLNEPLSSDVLRSRQLHIESRVKAESIGLRHVHFTKLCDDDLRLLYQLYDETFFESLISQELARGKSELKFRLGNRLTRAGAKTTVFKSRGRSRYEIAIATTLLAASFDEPGQGHWVAGVFCNSKLEALQRLMEHELIHVVEFLSFGKSSCRATRFRRLAANLFQHKCSHHRLLGPSDRLKAKTGLRIGDQVQFKHGSNHYSGTINRITKRATVLVPDSRGRRYTDGGRYRKFLVPLQRLIAVEAMPSQPERCQ